MKMPEISKEQIKKAALLWRSDPNEPLPEYVEVGESAVCQIEEIWLSDESPADQDKEIEWHNGKGETVTMSPNAMGRLLADKYKIVY